MISPDKALQQVSQRYQGAWQYVETIRRAKEDAKFDWPHSCFIPINAWIDIAQRSLLQQGTAIDKTDLLSLPLLAAVGTWRYSKGIYRFDETLYDALLDTPITGNIPSSLFNNLPEWCVYIETPNLNWSDKDGDSGKIHGMFVHVDYDMHTGEQELRFVFDSNSGYIPLPVQIGDWTIEDGLTRMREVSTERTGITYRVKNRETGEAISDTKDPKFKEIIKELSDFVSHAMSLVLYLCSEKKDVTLKGKDAEMVEPEMKIVKGKQRLFESRERKVYEVGYRIGSAIRKHNEQVEKEAKEPSGKPRGAMPAHVRRAHWHTYWRGARGTHDRTAYVLWLNPILVNVHNADDLITTVHPVL